MINRDHTDATIGLYEAEREAEKLLKEQGFEDVKRLRSSQHDKTGWFQYVVTSEDVWIYPDQIMIKVALDSGDIIGFNATDFYRNHQQREIKKPKLTLVEAKEQVSEDRKSVV